VSITGSSRTDEPLRLITYLSPAVPLELFEAIAEALGPGTLLVTDERASGPPPGEIDPFRRGDADVGFLCAPAYLGLRRRSAQPAVELLGLAPVFDDPRAGGRPVYFADVVVCDHPARSFADLRGSRLGFNDTESLSGLLALVLHLDELGEGLDYFASITCTGSHDASLQALAAGAIDVATIDSTTLRSRRDDPMLAGMRTIAALGPHPMQPIVVRADLPEERRAALRDALRHLASDPDAKRRLASLGCIGFAEVCVADYDPLEQRLLPWLEQVARLAEQLSSR
jgi:ABC-type phosphate/phosphonate transport system substrate-binding protein